MFDNLIKLYRERKELAVLEIAYLAIAIVSFAVSGIVALFNQAFGVNMLIIPLIAVVALVLNVVMWSVTKSAIEAIVARRKSRK